MPSKVTEPVRTSLAEPRLGVGYDPLAPSGLPPAGARQAPAVTPAVPEGLPVSVAREVWHRHMDRLKTKIADSERELSSPGTFAFMGNANPYAAETRRQHEAMNDMAWSEVRRLRDELASLSEMNDAEVADWAVRSGKVARHHTGGWMLA